MPDLAGDLTVSELSRVSAASRFFQPTLLRSPKRPRFFAAAQVPLHSVHAREEVIAACPLCQVLGELRLGMQVARRPENLVEQVTRVAMGQGNFDVVREVVYQEV